MTAPTPKAIRGLNCPNCGAAITLRTGSIAQTVVCDSCRAVLDAQDPNLRVLQKAQQQMKLKPTIPLGTRGSFKGEQYEATGFQVRSITVDDVQYYWREYVLWNPYKGFRYLTEYDGHWNDVLIAKSPHAEKDGKQPTLEYIGQTFRHFQSAIATTRFILGEFPWQVRSGDTANVRDFVSPPYMLSEESTVEETTWSVGTYVAPQYIWEAFKLPGKPPAPRGTYANQPNPNAGSWKGIGQAFAGLAALVFLLLIIRSVTAQRGELFVGRYSFAPSGASAESTAFVTRLFEITGHTSNVEVRIETDVSNNWAYFNLALIDDRNGTAYDFGREVSYYYGYDSDGSWSEGSRRDVSFVPSVPAGRYYLRVQPEGDPQYRGLVGYTVRLRRDVPRYLYYGIALFLLLVPPALAAFRHWSFESARWKESDYAPESDDDE